MDNDQAARISSAIIALAHCEGVSFGLRHVCLACCEAANSNSIGLYVTSDLRTVEPLHSTDSLSDRMTEWQAVLGEGPALDALTERRVVLVPDLDCAPLLRRWPMFTPTAVAAGVSSVFAFPLHMGSLLIGVFEVYRIGRGALTPTETADIRSYADAAMLMLVDRHQHPSDGDPYELGDGWREVHQATGMIAVQLGIDVAQALSRLRGHAFLTGRRLNEIANDVVSSRLRLSAHDDD